MVRVSALARFALALVPILSACGGSDDESSTENVGVGASPISGGYSDDGDHGAVGLAMVDDSGHVFRTCSGTLIADTLVVTAQHCIAETATFVDCTTSSFGPPMAGVNVRVTTAPSMWSSVAVWHTALDVRVPPGPPLVCGRDVALVILRERIPEDEAVSMTPQLDRVVEEQEVYTAIGYGSSTEGGDDSGVRRRRDALVVSCVGPGCGNIEHVDGREWRGDQGICNGDSGGPALDQDHTLIGVTSRGPLGCADPIYGGLTGYKDWIRATAVEAARRGDYTQPWWVTRSTADGPIAKADLPGKGWNGCSASRSPEQGGSIANAFALVALILAHRARRRTRKKAHDGYTNG